MMTPLPELTSLYERLLSEWNRRSAAGFASQFEPDGSIVGFDGSTVNGRTELEMHLAAIFQHHVTPTYVARVREVRTLSENVALLQGVAGMVPANQSDLNPALNTVQNLVAVRRDDGWRVALFHNTPAAFHGRPELAQSLTDELRAVLKSGKLVER